MITAREDFLHRVVAQSKGPFKLAVKDIMSTPLFTINKEILVDDAIMLMKSKNIARFPVVSDAGEVLGFVSLRSLIGTYKMISIRLALDCSFIFSFICFFMLPMFCLYVKSKIAKKAGRRS
ncbi:MAG TPA: CBS domain-containing protein [Nitrososphaera sp.]|nr:CBS domain-containing protein [Nitrososphaera sp.]